MLLSSYGVTGVFILLGAVSIIGVAIAIATIGIWKPKVSPLKVCDDAAAINNTGGFKMKNSKAILQVPGTMKIISAEIPVPKEDEVSD